MATCWRLHWNILALINSDKVIDNIFKLLYFHINFRIILPDTITLVHFVVHFPKKLFSCCSQALLIQGLLFVF